MKEKGKSYSMERYNTTCDPHGILKSDDFSYNNNDNGGEKNKLTQQHNLGSFKTIGDSVSLACLADKQQFTIKALEDSEYEGKPSVVITTVEEFDGKDLHLTEQALQYMEEDQVKEFREKKHSKFHTSRMAIIKTLKSPKLREVLEKGETVGPVKCSYVTKPKKGGKPYWELVEA